MNRILTDAARKRTERIEELETQVTQLERQVVRLKQELEPARKRARELEVVAAQRADLVNEKNKELAVVREELIKLGDLVNEKNKELAAVREELIKLADLVNEKNKELAVLRDALTRAQEDWGRWLISYFDKLKRVALALRAITITTSSVPTE
jgi:chromosome segregation ATPase